MSSLSAFFRLIRIGAALARHDALLPREYHDRLPAGAKLLGGVLRLGARKCGDEAPGERLARALEHLGPVAIKIGQVLATRGDVIGPEFADGLSRLKDAAPPFPQAEAEKALGEALGAPPDELFARFSEAVAAASIAQAHKAKTPDGREVAVKILRPDVEAQVAKDVDALRLAAGLAERFVPASRRLEPRSFVETVARALALELDLRMEAASAAEMAEISRADDGWRAPAVDWERTSRRVLTTEWIDGIPLSDLAAIEAAGHDRKALAAKLINGFLSSALETGTFHADMHEGNFFVLAGGGVAAVDFGIMGRIGPKERRWLARILHGFITRDYEALAETHFEAGYVPPTHTRADFAAALRAVGEPIYGKTAEDVAMSDVLLQLFDITDLFDMRLRPELVLLQKTMVQAEGVARRLDPALDIWAISEPVVGHFMRRSLGPEGLAEEALADMRRAKAALRALPDALDDFGAGAAALKDGRIGLSEESLKRLAREQAKATRWRWLALLALGAAGLVVFLI